jgi:hypothetical protein
MFVAGLGPVDSWPVAVYPRFADRKKGPTSHGMALGVFVVHRDGSELELPTALDVLGDPAAVYRVARTVIRARHRKDYKTLTQYEDLFIRLAERVYGRLQSGEQLRVLSYDFPGPQRANGPRERKLRSGNESSWFGAIGQSRSTGSGNGIRRRLTTTEKARAPQRPRSARFHYKRRSGSFFGLVFGAQNWTV